jgi:hypothetical protein
LRYGQDPELVVRTRLAHTLWLLGYPDEADRQRDLALRAADTSTHVYSRAVASVFTAILAAERGDIPGFRIQVEALDAYPPDEAPGQVSLAAEMFAGYLDVLDGRPGIGLPRVRHVRELVVHSRAPAPGVPGLATRLLLDAHAVAAEPESGLALADEALGMGRGAELWEPEIRRLRATFLAELGMAPDEVAAELRRALAVARRQGARAFEERVRATLTERCLSHDRAL